MQSRAYVEEGLVVTENVKRRRRRSLGGRGGSRGPGRGDGVGRACVSGQGCHGRAVNGVRDSFVPGLGQSEEKRFCELRNLD